MLMKKLLFVFVFLSTLMGGMAQVSISSDGSQPDPSAMLDVKSNSRGFLPPRMTHAEIEAIAGPVDGLIVYCTDCGAEGGGAFYGFVNGNWAALSLCQPPARPAAGIPQCAPDRITWNWTDVPGAEGYRWNTVNQYASARDVGSSLSHAETGLLCGRAFIRYVWVYTMFCGSLPRVMAASTTMSVS